MIFCKAWIAVGKAECAMRAVGLAPLPCLQADCADAAPVPLTYPCPTPPSPKGQTPCSSIFSSMPRRRPCAAHAFGADFLVRGAISLSNRLGMPPLLIGPDRGGFRHVYARMLVSLQAALDGSPAIAIRGNVGRVEHRQYLALSRRWPAAISPIDRAASQSQPGPGDDAGGGLSSCGPAGIMA